jgi:hypothetical protein
LTLNGVAELEIPACLCRTNWNLVALTPKATLVSYPTGSSTCLTNGDLTEAAWLKNLPAIYCCCRVMGYFPVHAGDL